MHTKKEVRGLTAVIDKDKMMDTSLCSAVIPAVASRLRCRAWRSTGNSVSLHRYFDNRLAANSSSSRVSPNKTDGGGSKKCNMSHYNEVCENDCRVWQTFPFLEMQTKNWYALQLQTEVSTIISWSLASDADLMKTDQFLPLTVISSSFEQDISKTSPRQFQRQTLKSTPKMWLKWEICTLCCCTEGHSEIVFLFLSICS